MAVYTHVDENALTPFLARYGLPPAAVFKGIAEGVENSNFFLEAGGTRFILTLYEKRVARDDLPYFLDLMTHVVAEGVSAAKPIPDAEGTVLQTLCGRPAALIEFLPGTSPDVPSLPQCRAGGEALAKLHLATASFAPTRRNSLGPDGWRDLANAIGPRAEELAQGLTPEISDAVARLSAAWPTDLPAGTIHADLFPDNVLFDGDTVSGMIDFYFACTDFYAYDLAISMNAWTKEGTTDPTAAQAFRAGYEAIRPLSEAERRAMPIFLQSAALRFMLTRAYDALHQVAGSLVRVKDPLPMLRLLRHHRDHGADFMGRDDR